MSWTLGLAMGQPGIGSEPLEEVVVIEVAPGVGAEVPAHKVPYTANSATAADLERSQVVSLADFLHENVASVTVNDATGNPLQRDVQFRGYTASPLLGLAQGIAVYQNGVRINGALGDTVAWDLMPESAVRELAVVNGTNPVFGLNALGGALLVTMKDGFRDSGRSLEVSGGSFGRYRASLEAGGNRGAIGYYANVDHFREDGWRDESPSASTNFYGSIGWRSDDTELSVNLQHGQSDLVGNGPVPIELARERRAAIFTAPDITDNRLAMVSVQWARHLKRAELTGIAHYRRHRTDAFNGDVSELTRCELGTGIRLLEGMGADSLRDLGFDSPATLCNPATAAELQPGGFEDSDALEDYLNTLGGGDDFEVEDLTQGLLGTGQIADAAINNISEQVQSSYGMETRVSLPVNGAGRVMLGISTHQGEASFDADVELAWLDPTTRSTAGLGTGVFLADAATRVWTTVSTSSMYALGSMDLGERAALLLSARWNRTRVKLRDRSGMRPELDGTHVYSRFNPALGLTFQAGQGANLYAFVSESSRTPTPIELACNDRVFEIAAALAESTGRDPEDIDLECRLPNAFLADPPLDQVVTRNLEAGVRGKYKALTYHAGVFHTVNRDDILFQTTGRSTGLFANVDRTRRRGFEGVLRGRWGQAEWFLAYSYLQATFERGFAVLSPNHPRADDAGSVPVKGGSRIPGLPERQWKAGIDLALGTVELGIDLVRSSDQVIRGDEANGLAPLTGAMTVNVTARYSPNEHLEVFAKAANLLDRRQNTFGLVGESPDELGLPGFEDFESPRFIGPAPPRSVHVGVVLRW